MKQRATLQAEAYVLGLETCTPAGGVALVTTAGRLAAQAWRDTTAPISQRLLAQVDALMREEGIGRDRIAAVAVTHGPGSFTGVRTGLAIAKTLAQGWGVRLYTYSTLAMLAARWPETPPGGLICPLLDARRGEIYSGVYRRGGDGRLELVRPERVESSEAFIESLAGLGEMGDGPAIALGSGAEVYATALQARFGARVAIAAAPWNAPGADVVALSGAADFRAELAGIDPLAAAPVYLRASDAERRHSLDVALTWSAT